MKRFALVFLTSCFLIACTNPYTPPGHEGYVREQPRVWGSGGFQGSQKGPRNFGISFWKNVVENIDFRPKTHQEPFKILAKDDLNISFNVQAVIKIKPGTVKTLIEEYGGNEFYDRYIKEPFRAMVRRNVQSFESREIKAKRNVIGASINEELVSYLKDSPFIIISCVVGNIDYPAVVEKAVEKKLAAKQLLEEKETQKHIAMKEAEIRVEEAKGIAAAQRIINETLTTNYLQHEAINAQLKMAASPNHTTVYIPSGSNGIPIVETIKGRK